MLKLATTVGLIAMFALGMLLSQRSIAGAESERRGLFLTSVLSLLSYPESLGKEVDWAPLFSGLDKSTRQSLVRSFVIGAPCLFVFGILLSLADEQFGDMLFGLVEFDVVSLPARVLIIGLITIFAGAVLRGLLVPLRKSKANAVDTGKTDTDKTDPGSKRTFEMQMLETGIVLGLINVMFAVFVFMQMGYLFGGVAYLESVPDITLAEYARRGFFELLIVASLAMFVMMWFRQHFQSENKSQEKLFNVLVSMQAGLLLVMLISASHRMWLYTANFGLTELRLYTSAFLVWLAFVIGWFVWTVRGDRTLVFVKGSVLAGFFVVVGLHLANPEGLIVRTNISRAVEGAPLDYEYLATLSADAVPTLLSAMEALPEEEQLRLLARFSINWNETARDDWRSWNLSQQIAEAKIRRHHLLASRLGSNTPHLFDELRLERTP